MIFINRYLFLISALVLFSVQSSFVWSAVEEAQSIKNTDFRDLVLTTHEGESFTLRELNASCVVINFIFTRCPSACPTQVSQLVAVQTELKSKGVEGIQFISISIDPEYDDARRLRNFAVSRNVDFANWIFVRGTLEQTDKIVNSFSSGFLESEAETAMDHKLKVVLLDNGKNVLQVYGGSFLDQKRIVKDIITVKNSSELTVERSN